MGHSDDIKVDVAPDSAGLPVKVLDDDEVLDAEERLPALTRGPGEGWGHFLKRLATEGHTNWDAFLTVAAAQIGQVMLTTPNSLWKTGFIAGMIWLVVVAVVSLWTMYMLAVMYLERKRDLIKAGTWYDNNTRHRSTVTQYHEVVGHFLGPKVQVFAQIIIALGLLGTSVAQVIACAADMYYIDKSRSKREWELIWGGVLMVFAFVPTFRHFRILNVIALIGTTYTSFLILAFAHEQGYNPSKVKLWPDSAQQFFTGGAVLLNAMGAHSIALEMMDAMQKSTHYVRAYFGGWLWTAMLVIPHSAAVNFAWPQLIGKNDNVYGVLPVNVALKISVWLMIVHQLVAFALYLTPVLFMWEKLIRTHHKPWYIRLPSRVPIALFVWFLGVAFPFYSSINAFMGSVSAPVTAFLLPAVAFNVIYKTKLARDNAVQPPPKHLQGQNWRWIFTFNWGIAGLFGAFGALAISFSLKSIVDNSYTFGVFAECYQCAFAASNLPAVPTNATVAG